MRVTVENIPSSASLVQKNQNAPSVGATKVVLYNYATQSYPDHPRPNHPTPTHDCREAVWWRDPERWHWTVSGGNCRMV